MERTTASACSICTSCITISEAFAILCFCLPLLSMTGECQTNLPNEMNANASTSTPDTMRFFPDEPIIVNDDSLDRALQTYSPFVLDCWELDCRPCKLIDPKINQMTAESKGKIVFGKLCTNYNPAALKRYGITRTPTLLIFNDSSLVYKHVGNYPKDELMHIILTVLHMR